ncbi:MULTISPECIES: hypothetical protein [unclassified Roseibium]|uniref:hypothetical protein n=1 Tax=unclassified Roseibium TaxID=2629323 RepID=UPI00273EA76F|nr:MULTISPECIES: hypothetical protein [unclassified Roseibium]
MAIIIKTRSVGRSDLVGQQFADQLAKAATRQMTPEQKRAQRISFIHGQTGVDKERISKILDGE